MDQKLFHASCLPESAKSNVSPTLFTCSVLWKACHSSKITCTSITSCTSNTRSTSITSCTSNTRSTSSTISSTISSTSSSTSTINSTSTSPRNNSSTNTSLNSRPLSFINPIVQQQRNLNDKQPWHNPAAPFVMKRLTKRITKCQGCTEPYTGESFVVGHKEGRQIFNKKLRREMIVFNNGYYHVNFTCIFSRHDYFKPENLVVPPGLRLEREEIKFFNEKRGFKIPLS